MSWLEPEIVTGPDDISAQLPLYREWLRIDPGLEDATLSGLIVAARGYVEGQTGLKLESQTVKLRASAFADLARFPLAPVQAIASIGYVDASGIAQTLDSAVYLAHLHGLYPFVELAPGQSWPATAPRADAVTVEATLGFASLAADEDLRLAMKFLVSAAYDGRNGGTVPEVVECLLQRFVRHGRA